MTILHLAKSRSKGNRLVLEGMSMTTPKVLTEPESTELLDRLAPDWPLLLHDGSIIDHILKVINKPRRRYRSHAMVPQNRVGSSEEAGMIALKFGSSN
jgi:hypothetical protein